MQGDLNRLPFRPAVFDFIYSVGVLHHLPHPVLGFRDLSVLLKSGESLITYVYEDLSDRSRRARAILAAIRGARYVSSRLPARLLYALCCLAVPLVWVTRAAPARSLRPVAPRLAERIPFRHTRRWNVLASDLFDRFAPPMEWRYSREAIVHLYHAAGLEGVATNRYRGKLEGRYDWLTGWQRWRDA